MPYDVNLKGKIIEIEHSVNGAYTEINDIIKDIEAKKRQFVIDRVKIIHESGEGIDITSSEGDELIQAFKDFENIGLKIAEKKMNDSIESGDFSSWPLEQIDKFGEKIIVTTETCISDMQIEKRIEVVTAEIVFGLNVIRDIFAGFTDFFGGRSGQMQKVMRDARKVCMTELKREALIVGANAVVGVRLNYSEISGKNMNMIMLAGSGTAVKLRN